MVIGMVTGEEHMTKGILAYTPFGKAGQSLYVLYQGKRLFTVVCMLFFILSIRVASSFL